MPFGLSKEDWEKEKAKARVSALTGYRTSVLRRGARREIQAEARAQSAKRKYGMFSEFATEVGAFTGRSASPRPQRRAGYQAPQEIGRASCRERV